MLDLSLPIFLRIIQKQKIRVIRSQRFPLTLFLNLSLITVFCPGLCLTVGIWKKDEKTGHETKATATATITTTTKTKKLTGIISRSKLAESNLFQKLSSICLVI